MPRNLLITDWLTIGTEGPTADGRTIKGDDLVKMAESYDPENYTAVVNVGHRYGNLGTVRELRTIKDKQDRTALQARIRPNKYYLWNNGEDIGLFFSMEISHNFAKTGKPYLTGLASLDKPASLGTSEVHFGADNKDVMLAESVQISPDVFKIGDDSPENDSPRGIVQAFASALKEVFSPNTNSKEEKTEMTEDQVKTLLAAEVSPLKEAVTSLTESVNGIAAKFADQAAGDGGGADDGAGEGTQTPAEDDDKFKNLENAVSSLTESFKSLAAKLPEAFKPQGKDIPDGTGGNDASFV